MDEEAGLPPGDSVEPELPHGPGWFMASLVVAIVISIAYAFLVYVPNSILTGASSMTRSWRVTVATIEFAVALALLAFGLRRLQARSLGS